MLIGLVWSGSSRAIKHMLNFKHINRSTEVNKTGYVLKVKFVLKYFTGLW